MGEKKKRSIKNLVFAMVGQIITISVGLILPRLYITNYGSEINGLLNSINQYLVYLGLFEAGVGLCTQQALYKPVAEGDQYSINRILAATDYYYKRTGFYYLLSLIGLSAIYPLIIKSTIESWVVFLAMLLSGMGSVLPFWIQAKYRFFLIAEGKNYVLTTITTATTVLTGFLKAIMITAGAHVTTVLFVTFIIHLCFSLFLLLYIKKNYKWINLNVEPNKNAVSQKNYTLIHQIAGMIFQNTDVLLLTMFCDLKIVSVYSMYKLVISHLESILSMLSNSVEFVLGQTFQNNQEAYGKKIDSFESLYSGISFALFSVALFLFAPFMKLYTSGVEDITYVDPVLSILFITIALLTAARTPMIKTINFAGHFKKTTPQTLIETGINLIFSIIGVLTIGIYGVLLGTIAALLYRTNDVIVYANKVIMKRSPRKTYLTYVVNLITFFVVQLLLFMILNADNIDSYFDLVGVGICATAISLLLHISAQVATCPELRERIGMQLKKQRRNRAQERACKEQKVLKNSIDTSV